MSDENVVRINDQLAIPTAELEFRFSTSGGPGGQHVNKVETHVVLLFDVASSPSLDEATRERLLEKLASRLTQDGVLQIGSRESRSQYQNRESAVERFREVIAQALIVPKKRRPTKPSRVAVEKRLEAKRRRSQLKRHRRPVATGE
jgi:ribosome-associated protein